VKKSPTAAVTPERSWPRCGSPNIWSCRACYTPKYWDSCALPNTPRSALASRGDYFTSSEGRNYLEMEVKPGKIQARATKFSTVSQRSGRKARRTAVQYPWTLAKRTFILLRKGAVFLLLIGLSIYLLFLLGLQIFRSSVDVCISSR
jgi:hypothetical protein